MASARVLASLLQNPKADVSERYRKAAAAAGLALEFERPFGPAHLAGLAQPKG